MILKERMFRVKPYTQCIDCIRTDHFKCKNCMDKLVNQIMAKKDNGTPQHLLRRSPKFKHLYDNKYPVKISFKQTPTTPPTPLKHSTSVNSMRVSHKQKPSQQHQYEIHSKYDLWMRHVNYKNDQTNVEGGFRDTLKQWPVKKRVYLSTSDMNRQEGRFERWEQKFLERIKDSDQREAIEKQRCAKTALVKLRV